LNPAPAELFTVGPYGAAKMAALRANRRELDIKCCVVGRAHRREQHAIALGIVLAGMLLAGRPCAFALNPALDVSQYAHTAWKIREGFTKGRVYSIAQTPDCYLWLGTEFGLLRFDGVRNVPWQPPPDQHLPSSNIMSLLAARDGTLLDRHPQRAGKLEGQPAYSVPGAACTAHYCALGTVAMRKES